MNKAIRENRGAWVAALRSGEYKQSRAALQAINGHCCLGVGGEVMEKRGMATRRQGEEDGKAGGKLKGLTLENYPEHKAIAKALGLSVEEGRKLVRMNDERRQSFEQIAKYIERETRKHTPGKGRKA